MKTAKTTKFLAAVAGLGLTSMASAATITWTSSGAVSSDSEVITTGTLVGAVNMGQANAVPGGSAQTVNTVPFQADPGGTITFSANPSVTLATTYDNSDNTVFFSVLQPAPLGVSTAYQNILQGTRWSSNNTTTLTLSGLTVGQQYSFQFWSIDERNTNSRGSILSDGVSANTITLNRDTSPQWAVGTFTAGGTTQNIVENALHNGDTTQVNAFQIRAVPEPASLGLFGAAGIGLLARRRRRS